LSRLEGVDRNPSKPEPVWGKFKCLRGPPDPGSAITMASGRTPLPFLALGVLAFLLAVWAGLLRVGWPWPSPAAGLPAAHAVLMVSGFLGSLISLERAVGLRASWGYVAPVASVLGSFALLVPPVQFLAPVLLVFASGVGVALLVALLFVHRTPAVALMCAGMASWLVGNLVWAARFPALLAGDALLWWIGFPVLLIAGERVELARFRPTAISAGAALYGLAALFIVASVVGLVRPLPANHLAGAALAGPKHPLVRAARERLKRWRSRWGRARGEKL